MKRWEYIVQTYDVDIDDGPHEKELDRFGVEGWELVALSQFTTDGAARTRAVFKRRLQEKRA